MNGFSLLLALASISVVYSWRTGVDQQQEYVLQIEPEIVQALTSGEEIFSDVPENVGPLARLCITVLPKEGVPARHTAAGEEQFRQLLLSAGRYASRDRTLVTGDSQTTILWPGRAGANPEQTYGVTTGWQPDAAGKQQYLVQIDPTVLSTLSIGDELYVPVDPAAGRMVRFIVKSGRANLPRLGGTQPTSLTQTPPATAPSSRSRYPGVTDSNSPAWSNSTAPDSMRQPAALQPAAPQPPPSRYGNAYAETPVDPRGSQYTSPPASAGYQGPTQPGYGNATVPPGTNYPNYNPSPAAPTAFDQYRQPQAPGSEYGTQPGYNVPANVHPVASQQPQLPAGQRQFNSPANEPRVAALPTTVATTGATVPLNTNMLPHNNLTKQEDRPWGPLLFVTFALFFSIGGNLYLAYTALEFHGRYRSAIERLRSAARSS